MNQYLIDDATLIEKFQAAVLAFGEPKIRQEKAEREPLIIVNMRENLLINHVMKSFIERAYQYDPKQPHVDYLEITGHLKKGVTVPMASRFRGLTQGQKQKLISALNQAAAEDQPLFLFDNSQRRWMINLYHYSELKFALAWWSKHCLDDGAEDVQNEAQNQPARPDSGQAHQAATANAGRRQRQPQTAHYANG